MIVFTLKEIAEATGGTLDGGDADALVSSVAIDSRLVAPGGLFVALRGERADGHAFVRDAAQRGAVASLVAQDRAPDEAGALVRVADPAEALAHIARAARARLHATVVAITGSSGKTCTKEFTAAAIAMELQTVASHGNFNNEIGVPLTILTADAGTRALVVEVGARSVGDIASLMPVVRPDVSVVTNVGSAHVGIFGSLDNTARAKGELVEALGEDGIAILNADDPVVAAMATRTSASVITFGLGDADVRAEDVIFDAGGRASFTITSRGESASLTVAIPGEHMVANALAAAAAALAAGVSLDGAAAGIASCRGAPMRMELTQTGDRTVLNDAYNANPDSMAAALKTLVAIGRGRPTWAVLGQMAELGDSALEEHDRIGRLAVRLGVAHLVTIGREARALHEAARHEGMPPDEAMFCSTVDEALQHLRARLEPNAVVLVKASRAAALERVVEGIAE